MLLKSLSLACFLILTQAVIASETNQPKLDSLQKVLNGAEPDSVESTVMPGLYEVMVNSQIFYLSEDGRFVIQGDIIDLGDTNNPVNLTENRRGDLRNQLLESVDKDQRVVFAPKEPAKHVVAVFTDIDCGYCRKLHQEMAAYNEKGIEIDYLMYPRSGVGSASYNKAVAVWCSDDKQDAMTRAKQGENLPAKSSENPVEKHYALGNALGVRGTPALILENGQVVPGYVPPERLLEILENTKS